MGKAKIKLTHERVSIRSQVSNFVSIFLGSKAAPTKTKPSNSKPLIINSSSFCHDKFAEKISSYKKIKYFPSFVCLLDGECKRAAVLKSNFNGGNNLSPYLIFSKKLEHIYVGVRVNLPKRI